MNLDDDDSVDELPARPRQVIPAADRELLELAGRALGAVQVEDVDGEKWVNLHFADGSTVFHWNPLLFYGDTFDLVVRLGLVVAVKIEDKYAIATSPSMLAQDEMELFEDLDPDPLVSTARAVVRTAAKIGKQRS